MSILNRGWIYDSITRNQDSGSVSYRWTHGANDNYIGSGIMYFSIPYRHEKNLQMSIIIKSM